ncbi:MAG: hypothetical protein IT222_00700, partial [Crocinitomix sp.]|nr:hypothetical protein [Crocinitomix sp.]
VDFVVENQYIETNLNWARLLKLINTYRIYEERLIFQTSLASKTFITLLNKTFHPSTLEVANESQLFSLGRYLKMFDDFYVDSILDHIHEIIIDSQTKENLRSKLNNFATVCIRPTDIDYLKATLETGNEDQRNLACFYAIQLYCYPRHINVGFEILNCISNVIEQENLNARSCHLIISLMEEGQVIVNDTFRKAILTFYTRHAKYITIYRSANSLINCNLKEAIPFLEHLLSNEYNTHDSYVFYLLHGIDLSYYFKYFDHFSELYITVLEAVTILASACAEPRDKAIKTLESFKTDKVKETLEYATYIGNEKIAYQVKLMYQSSSYFRESERDDLRRTHFTLNSRIEAFQKNGEIEKSQAHHINDSKK